nr:uncharacterized protein LOC101244431 isoform X3 [Solanum lycopersicum]
MASSSSTKNNTVVQSRFIKIILFPHECIHLSIPHDFERRCCNDILSPVHLEVPTGQVWEVELRHSEGHIWFTKGWQDFCDYYSISRGHFLMFGYNTPSHFDVTIFDVSAAEIEYPYSSRTFHFHETHHAPIIDLSESDVDIMEDTPRRQKLKEKVVDHSLENLCYGQISKRKRHGDDVASPSFTKKVQNCRIHKKDSKSVYDQNKTVMEKESSTAYQQAKAFKSKNPFIISFMQPSYVSASFNLSIPLKFARKYFLENNGNLVLRVPGIGSWSVKCTLGMTNGKVGSGWKAFVQDNKLKVGDVCVFEVLKGQLFVDVIIFRAAGSTLMHNIVAEVPRVPCSQPKVVQTKKSKQHTGGSYGLNLKIKVEQGEGTEILGHCPSGRGSKRKQSEVDAVVPSFTKKAQNCRIHKKDSKSVYDQNKTVMEKESSTAYQQAKAFKSKNPFTISFMQPSYVSASFNLSIPLKFARKYFLENNGNLVLRVPGIGSWSVKCTLGMTNGKVGSGWKAFVQDNKLKVGDICVFEVLKGQLFVDVIIFRVAGSTLMHNIVAEVPRVPCSQPKVVQTKKSKQHTGGSYGLNLKIKEEQGEGTEILGHCPSGRGSKRKQPEVDAVVSSFTRKTKKSGGSCGLHKKQSKIVYDKNKTVTDKKSSIAYQRAKAFKSKNPFIVSFMQPSYISKHYILKIWSAFARKYFLENDGNLVLRVSGSGSWSVKCTITTASAKFNYGWKTFVLENELKLGDVCVFEVIKGGQLFVDVTIFRAAGSIIVAEVPGRSDRKSKVIKEEHGKGTEIEHSVKVLGHCPLGNDSKRRRPARKAEDVASPSFTRKPKKSGESCRMHKQQTKMVNAKRKTVLDKEMTIAYQRAKAFRSKNPFVIYFMQPSYVSRPYNLHMTFSYAQKYLWEKCGDLVLRAAGRGSWSVKYDLGLPEGRIRLSWRAFVLDNKLKSGDVCVFELIKGTQPFLDVIIFRANERKPKHTTDGGVSGFRNKIIKTENSVPCPRTKIDHSRKHNLEKKHKGDSDGFITSKVKEELREGTLRHGQQSTSFCMGTVVAKEMVLAYQKAKAFTSENPFFLSFMQPSYVSLARGPIQLSIASSVARKFFSTRQSDVVLEVSSKRRWTVKCSVGIKTAKFSCGWKEFVVDNKLKVGDVCIFEWTGRPNLVFNVIIFPSCGGI